MSQLEIDAVFEGVYGPYRIDAVDRREVLLYRLSLLVVALAQIALLAQWQLIGAAWIWPWWLLLALALGLSLHWIHIYLLPLHRALQLFWLLGCAGSAVLIVAAGPDQMLPTLAGQRQWVLAIGPLFAALAGIGFKEFFCFRRPEAIGVTLLLPVALLGFLSGLLDGQTCLTLLAIESGLLLLLCLRKFPMPAAADVGDKSVFAALAAQRQKSSPLPEEA